MAESKIFVGGLSWETTQDSLKTYFEGFGTVTDVTLKTDVNTGKSRGFGFVTFADASSVSQVLSTTTHMLDGRKIDPKVAQAKGGREPCLKVFVGGLDPTISEDEIRAHFGQYGAIDKVELPFDKVKQQRRAFCFVQFQAEDAVNAAVASNKQSLGTSEVDVKKATPPQSEGFGGRGGFGGGRGGGRGRGGRGGYGGGYGAQGGYGGGYGSYGGGYSGGYGNGYGNGYSSSGSYDQSYGSQKYSGYGAGDDSYGAGYGASSGGWGGQQTQSRGYHPYQR